MKWCVSILAVVFFVSLPRTSQAQDQTEVIGGPRGGLTGDESKAIRDVVGNGLHGVAAKLIKRTLGSATGPADHADWIDDPDFACIIHVVLWNSAKQEVKAQRWFLYRPGVSLVEFESLRIFGFRKVGLLYLHLDVSGPAREQTERVNAAEQLGTIRKLDDGGFVSRFFAQVSYRVDVVKKLPAPVANLAALAGTVQAREAELVLVDKDVWGGRIMEIRHVPSDITVRLLAAGALSQTEAAKQTYDNEGRYVWDVSVALPVTKLEQLKFDFANGLVTAKKIEKQGLIAVFNFFPKPIDTKGIRPSYVPHLLIGVALSKQPLDTLLLAGGIGINKTQFFAGVSWVRMDRGNGVNGGDVATKEAADRVTRVYDAKFVAGINISVTQVVQALKK